MLERWTTFSRFKRCLLKHFRIIYSISLWSTQLDFIKQASLQSFRQCILHKGSGKSCLIETLDCVSFGSTGRRTVYKFMSWLWIKCHSFTYIIEFNHQIYHGTTTGVCCSIKDSINELFNELSLRREYVLTDAPQLPWCSISFHVKYPMMICRINTLSTNDAFSSYALFGFNLKWIFCYFSKC